MRETVTGYELTPGESTRYDLAFMARMLGITVWETSKRWEYGYPPADEVEARMANPIANARARQRIAQLINELPILYQQATLCGDPRLLSGELPITGHSPYLN